jgi:hypothetical protein
MEYRLVVAQRTQVWRPFFKTRAWDPHFVFQGCDSLEIPTVGYTISYYHNNM